MSNRSEQTPISHSQAVATHFKAVDGKYLQRQEARSRVRESDTRKRTKDSATKLNDERQKNNKLVLKHLPGFREAVMGRRAFFEVSAITLAFWTTVSIFPKRSENATTPGYDSNDPDDFQVEYPKKQPLVPSSIEPPTRNRAPVFIPSVPQPEEKKPSEPKPETKQKPKDPKEWFVSQTNGNECGLASFAMVVNEAGTHKGMFTQLMATIMKGDYDGKGITNRDENGLRALSWLEKQGIKVTQLTEAMIRTIDIPRNLDLELIKKTLAQDPTVRILISFKPNYVAENTNETHIAIILGVNDDGTIDLADPAFPKYVKSDNPPLITKKLSDLGLIHYSFALMPDADFIREVEQLKLDYKEIAEMAPEGFNYHVWIKSVRKAIEIEEKYGISKKVTLAQIFLETARGNKIAGNNILGIKAVANEKSLDVATHEEINGKKIPTVEPFRDLESIEEAIEAYAILLTTAPRYKKLQELISKKILNPHEQIAAIASAGYATDSDYGRQLSKIVDLHLKQLDKLSAA